MVLTLDDFTITQNEERDLASWMLEDAYKNIVPCSGSKSYCEDITDYPSKQIDAVLLPNLQQEYFNKVFTGHTDKACQKTSEKVIGQTNVLRITHSLASKLHYDIQNLPL